MHKTRESIDTQQKSTLHPIIFSTPMIRAILDGSKTMTRRIVKPQPKTGMVDARLSSSVSMVLPAEYVVDNSKTIICPYGKPGDRLWVRETFRYHGRPEISGIKYIYKADKDIGIGAIIPWKPSIYMPQEACRIFLEIMSVRAERLQEITMTDAAREGIEKRKYAGEGISYHGYKCYTDNNGFPMVDPRASFGSLWDYINGSGSWNRNPWVWVIDFKRV